MTGYDNPSVTPMYNPEDRVWAVENFYKEELTVTDPNPVSGEYSTCENMNICIGMIFTIFFITFFNMPTIFLILPWAIGVPIMAVPMYLFATIFFLLTFCLLVRPAFQKNIITI